MKEYYVYIMASKRNGTLYTGVTSDLVRNIQAWKRNWKVQLIETNNPNWNDLYNSIV